MSLSREQTQEKLDLLAQGIAWYKPQDAYGIADRFEELAMMKASSVFLRTEEESLSYAALNRRADYFAALALERGLRPGDTGAILFENRPAFFYSWLGLMKIGVRATLLNTSMRGAALAHALGVTSSSFLFAGEECSPSFQDARALPAHLSLIRVPDVPATPEEEGAPVDSSLRKDVRGETPAMYSFTSGTTGLPKAAVISHARWLGVGKGWHLGLGINSSDVFYCCLPLFHGAAGMSLVSPVVSAGASIVLRRKFSASQFWEDVRRYKVTSTQYIGETCRYLVNQPASPKDRDHGLRRMTGAGLSPDVWKRFRKRFGEQIEIIEGMGAIESNCSLSNLGGKIGACGHIPFPEKSNARLVKYDVEKDCHVRDKNGFLVLCEPQETGELIGMLIDLPNTIGGRFEGYSDAQETEKKILRNVFAAGDAWFRTGDLLYRDEEDYYYFVDRLGDTFRWKSENVSTTEVAEALASYRDAALINVYGVRVPEQEGRAGMAAVLMLPGRKFDGEAFYKAAAALPGYAVPLFVRLSKQPDLTATFKLRKVDMQRQGYDPDNFEDPLYVLNRKGKSYLPWSEEALENLGVAPFEAPPEQKEPD